MDAPTVEQLAEEMFQMVSDAMGKKNLKASDLMHAMQAKYGEAGSRDVCKAAIRTLMDSGRCVYAYFGGSYIQLPHKEGAAND